MPQGGKPEKKRSSNVSFFLKKMYFWGRLLVCILNGNSLFCFIKPFLSFSFFFSSSSLTLGRGGMTGRLLKRAVSVEGGFLLVLSLLQVRVHLCAAEKALQINPPKWQRAVRPSRPLSARWPFLTDVFPPKDEGHSDASVQWCS